jgi:uncharacterized protein YfbU (UPF0304 family)
MELAALNAPVRDYIMELEANYELRLKELQHNFEALIKESEHKYLILQERYDLLLYKRYARSAEQLRADTGQQLLFTTEGETTETVACGRRNGT